MARAGHHAERLVSERAEDGRRGGRVGIAAIDQNVSIRLDVGQYPSHDVAPALKPLAPHQGAGALGRFHRAVAGIAVEDVDRGMRQAGAEIRQHARVNMLRPPTMRRTQSGDDRQWKVPRPDGCRVGPDRSKMRPGPYTQDTQEAWLPAPPKQS